MYTYVISPIHKWYINGKISAIKCVCTYECGCPITSSKAEINIFEEKKYSVACIEKKLSRILN